ncbi:MAG: AmmeMemoRadiSam system protein B [Candidatus Sulfotelmatobacter sp.]
MSTMQVRHPAFAGRFYPREPKALREDVRTYLSQTSPQAQTSSPATVRALGCIAPHAGYMYSGHVAGAVFGRLEIPELCIVMCPNHTGMGRPLAIMSEGEWETPLGRVLIDTSLAIALKRQCPLLEEDLAAHRTEHATEVELPFLQLRQPNLKFVPIVLGTGNFELLEQLGLAVAVAIAEQNQPVLIVASSDMNHYESDAVTRVKDQSAIEAILRLDAFALYEVVTKQHVSMCGFGPAIVMLTAAKSLGGTSAELLKYATSGDISGDHDTVVGYAGIIVRGEGIDQ